ncbi:MAG: UvrD-helicase domain-containing protein [Eggerthellaceae bacterium]|nr:UvrD-helicase domain-containing protein [Eggerthellaceae bacterium]
MAYAEMRNPSAEREANWEDEFFVTQNFTDGQKECVKTLDKAVVIAAGAGSGKTHTLTKRIIWALKSGYVSDISEICAITFTKKAAAELKSRIKAGLREWGMAEQALKADEAWVSTIHGMCARILRAHALELGIDPAFSVVGDVEVKTYLANAIDQVLVRAQSTDHSPQLDALFKEYPVRSYGFGGTSVAGMLEELVGKASANERGVDAFVMPGITLAPAVALAQALEAVEVLLEAAERIKQSPSCVAWKESVAVFTDAAHEALDRGLSDHSEALRILSLMKFDGRIGTNDFKALRSETKQRLSMCVMEVSLGAARAHLETLVGLAREVLDVYRDLKLADGVLDNDDLLVLTAHAFENHKAIAERYTDKFKLVMIDEFQDTGQMEVDMVKRFAGKGACRLCTVGDAQQSIYRFRSADVSVYRRHLEAVRTGGDGAVIELSENFRSHRDVLSFVDRIFGKPEMFGKEFMSLAAGRAEEKVKHPFNSEVPRIKVLHTSYPYQKGISSADTVEASARRVAREFARLKEEGHSAGEMAVLLGRMKNSGVFARALRDEGLPCVISGGSVFSSTPEASAIRCLVRALSNAKETQALFNVLTSPMFGLTSGDVLKAGRLGGFVRHAVMAADDDPERQGWSLPLQCALDVMGRAWKAVAEEPVSRVVSRVALESGWIARMQGWGPEGLASAGNVYKAIRMIEGVEASGAYGPVSVMRGFEAELDNAKEAPGALSVTDSDSVRIMTVHASKGLEFPIVAVAEFKEERSSTDCLLATSVDGNVYLSLNLSRSLSDLGLAVSGGGLDAMADYILGEQGGEDEMGRCVTEDAGALHRLLAIRGHVNVGDAEEANRLLYVALTRAEEALVVSMTGMRTKDNPVGTPKSAFRGIMNGLDPAGDAFSGTRTMVDYGGTLPAVVETVALDPGCEELEAFSGGIDADGERLFSVPAFGVRETAPVREPYHPAHAGVFSYSSISDSSHEGDALVDLADAYAGEVDQAAAGDGFGEGKALSSFSDSRGVSFDDDDYLDFDVSAAFDKDRATDLGTAFHRLAQYAVLQRGDDGALALPPADRIEALARVCRLDGGQRSRLKAALARWFGCKVAHEMAELPELSAEVPFFISVADLFLEGEIDLLGFDEAREHAYVVDYKTGGSPDESSEDLRCKHVLQAACYAYAIMLQGISQVDATFVRVERPRAGAESEPQCVRYRFEAKDLPQLERAISEIAAR